MPSTINEQPILSCALKMPAVGVWHASLVSDGTEAFADGAAATISIEGQSFAGTVIRSSLHGGRVSSKVAGGAGKMPTVLDSKQYASGTGAGATVGAVVKDILREAGESLSGTSDTAILDASLPKWQRSRGPASRALVDVLEPRGSLWRVLDDGTIWVGPESYPEAVLGDYVLTDEDWTTGVYELAPLAPDLRPGVTLLGSPITYVVHDLSRSRLRTEAYVTGSPGNHFERIFGQMRREIDFSRMYTARVVKQNSDKTVELSPDDPVMRSGGRSLDKVPIRCGIPAEVEVTQGVRCVFAFANGDPGRPIVMSFESTAVTLLRINGGTLPAARQGEITMTPFPATVLAILASQLLCAAPGAPPTLNPAAALLVAAQQPIPLADLYGSVTSGNPATEL